MHPFSAFFVLTLALAISAALADGPAQGSSALAQQQEVLLTQQVELMQQQLQQLSASMGLLSATDGATTPSAAAAPGTPASHDAAAQPRDGEHSAHRAVVDPWASLALRHRHHQHRRRLQGGEQGGGAPPSGSRLDQLAELAATGWRPPTLGSHDAPATWVACAGMMRACRLLLHRTAPVVWLLVGSEPGC